MLTCEIYGFNVILKGPSRDYPWKGRRSVPEAWEENEYGGTIGFSMAMGSAARPNASCVGINLWEAHVPLGFSFQPSKEGSWGGYFTSGRD
jgi:hypothetical protein